MLKILNDLKHFFEDCYWRAGIREYARIIGVSPPTASSLLSLYHKEGLLVKPSRTAKLYANRESRVFVALSRLYWQERLKPITEHLELKLFSPAIVLFGSLSKAEVNRESDIDLAVFATKKALDVTHFERKLKRSIQIFWFPSLSYMKDSELATSIINGHVLSGRLRL